MESGRIAGAARALLLVDRDHDLASALQALLEQEGWLVIHVVSDEAGTRFLQRYGPPDALLVDWPSPAQRMLLAETLRRNPAWERIPIVVTSPRPAATQHQDSPHTFVLERPFGADALLTLLNQIALGIS